MTVASGLHNEAMDCAGRALVARMRGDEAEAQRLFEEAFAKEAESIEALEERERVEPMHSVLHRSAATLALDCGRLREAEKSAAKGLAIEPYPAVATELRDVLERVFLERRFEGRTDELAPGEMEMVLSGDGVGHGFADASEVINRVEGTTKLVRRIVQLQAGKPYRSRRFDKAVSSYGLRMSVPKAGSFAVNLQVTTPPDGSETLDVEPQDIIDQFLELMGLLNENALGVIEKRVKDVGYFANFLELGKSIMPDGVRVTQVGFAATGVHNAKRSTVLIRPAYEVPTYGELGRSRTLDAIEGVEPDATEIEGRLLFADAVRGNSIKVLDKQGKAHALVVPAEMMNDVGKLWGSQVRATGVYDGKNLVLEGIDPG